MLNFTTTSRFKIWCAANGFTPQIGSGVLLFGLFSNPATPAYSSVLADFTAASFGGYAGLLPWLPSSVTIYQNGAGDAQWDGSGITWSCDGTSSGNVYGIYARYSESGTPYLAGAVLIPGGPVVMQYSYQSILMTPHGQMAQL